MHTLRRLLVIVMAGWLTVLLAPADAQARPSRYPGMSSYPTYNDHFSDGPAIGHLGGYIPQGLAYWQGKDALVTTYYDEDDAASPALLSVRDRLGAKAERTWLTMMPGHAGGAVISGPYLWVASTTAAGTPYVYRYSLAKVAAAKHQSYLGYDQAFRVAASSYVTVRDGDLWVGKHTTSDSRPGRMYRYDISTTGALTYRTSRATAGRVQGAVFSGERVIYSRSWTRTKASTITVENLSTGRQRSFAAPSMIQGAAIADGRLYLTTESGASYYRYGEDNGGTKTSKNPITTTHYASLSWLQGLV